MRVNMVVLLEFRDRLSRVVAKAAVMLMMLLLMMMMLLMMMTMMAMLIWNPSSSPRQLYWAQLAKGTAPTSHKNEVPGPCAQFPCVQAHAKCLAACASTRLARRCMCMPTTPTHAHTRAYLHEHLCPHMPPSPPVPSDARGRPPQTHPTLSPKPIAEC